MSITRRQILQMLGAGLVTFHGPVGTSTWNQFSTGYIPLGIETEIDADNVRISLLEPAVS
jgi:hypothetical protein